MAKYHINKNNHKYGNMIHHMWLGWKRSECKYSCTSTIYPSNVCDLRPCGVIWFHMSIPMFPQLWDTDLLCTEYAQNYWLEPQTSVRRPTLKLLTRVPVDSSPRRLSVDRCWNYWLESQSTLVPDVCPSTYAKTIWLESQSSVFRPTQKLLTHIPAVCPLAVATTNDSCPRHLSSDSYRN